MRKQNTLRTSATDQKPTRSEADSTCSVESADVPMSTQRSAKPSFVGSTPTRASSMLGDDLQHPPSIRHDRLRKAQQAAASGPFRSRPLFLPPSAVRIRLATLLAHVAIWVNSASPLQFQPSRSRVGPPQDAPNASLASENYGRPNVTHPLLGGAGSPRTEKGPVGARGARRSACQ